MKTAVVMKREIFGSQVSQNSKTEMFSATDLAKIGNKWRIANDLPVFTMKSWLNNKSTKEFISELEEKYGKGNVKKPARGKGSHTWFHPLLFIDMALAISPKLKIETYEWLFDNLIKYRNEGGDSYKVMCGALYVRTTRKTNFPQYISDVANKIKLACHVVSWDQATERQLNTRSKLHNDIALLADVLNNNDEAVRIAIKKLKAV
jgi:hypothetical protein